MGKGSSTYRSGQYRKPQAALAPLISTETSPPTCCSCRLMVSVSCSMMEQAGSYRDHVTPCHTQPPHSRWQTLITTAGRIWRQGPAEAWPCSRMSASDKMVCGGNNEEGRCEIHHTFHRGP